MTNEILTAIVSKFDQSTLAQSIKLYYYQLPRDVSPKPTEYITFFEVGKAKPQLTMGARLEPVIIQFNLYARNPYPTKDQQISPLSINAKAASLMALFDECQLTLTNSTSVVLSMIRQFAYPQADPDGGWDYIIEYQLDTITPR